jgi:hypothetical protein
MLHRDEERYLGFLLARARMVEPPGSDPGAGIGDVILFKVGRCFAHGGIVTGAAPLTMIHAYSQAGFVIEDEVDRCPLAQRPRAFASYWRLPSPGLATRGHPLPQSPGQARGGEG